MEELLKQIELALQAGLYWVALQSTLTIPDICGKIDYPNIRVGKRYIKWYDTNVKQSSDFMTGKDCYGYRCTIIHEGKSKPTNSKFNRIMFLEPNSQIQGHNNIIDDALWIDINIFCNNIICACKKWLIEKESDPNYIKIKDDIVGYHPNGIPPYIVGLPIYS